MRKATGAIVLAAMSAVLAAAVPAGASTSPSDEAEFLRMLNERRASRGVRALQSRSDLVTIARRHSGRMASSGNLHHNPRLAREVRGEREVGENVGVGPDASSLDQAFWESGGHRANILYRGYNQVGIGVVKTEYEMYVTVVFVDRPASSPTQPAPDAEPSPKPTSKSTSGGEREPDRSEDRDANRGASRPEREPEREPQRSVDLLLRTVALDAG